MSRRLLFTTLDVFTRRRFSGKPLVVFDDADALAPAEMATLAREFNFPIAAFLCAPRDQTNSARLRVFALEGERAFAAHAAIGAAVLLAQTRAAELLARRAVVIAIEFGDTVVSCETIRNRDGICYSEFALSGLPKGAGAPPRVETVARGLTLSPEEIDFASHSPRVYQAFERFAFAPVRSYDALERACPSPFHFARALGDAAGLFLYSADPSAPDGAVHARLFGPGGAEDPASGEAALAFAAVAAEFERPEDGEHQVFIEQGQALGRGSRLTLRLSVASGEITALRLGGQAVEVTTGEIKL